MRQSENTQGFLRIHKVAICLQANTPSMPPQWSNQQFTGKSCISYGQCCVIHKEGYKLFNNFFAVSWSIAENKINCGEQKNQHLKQEPLITSRIITKCISSHLIQFWGRSTSKQQRRENKHCTPTMSEKQKWKWKRTMQSSGKCQKWQQNVLNSLQQILQ
jgi:hypothetical protein